MQIDLYLTLWQLAIISELILKISAIWLLLKNKPKTDHVQKLWSGEKLLDICDLKNPADARFI